jgi:HEAT repeat protein
VTDPEQLIARLSTEDANERAAALAGLVAQGSAAVPALRSLLEEGDDQRRAAAARALAEIADPDTADALARATEDSEPAVRGHAAVGLARIGDPRAPEALARTIDDVPDLLHHPYTAAVRALIGLGELALPAVLPLLSAEDPVTRERAALVVQAVRR